MIVFQAGTAVDQERRTMMPVRETSQKKRPKDNSPVFIMRKQFKL
jgi:hypothetical protein